MNSIQQQKLLTSLQKLPTETEWVEFKVNRADPEEIGEYISAISNTAKLKDEPYGYMVWGINDQTHEIVGTNFIPKQTKKGNEELEHWLVKSVTPHLDIRFYSSMIEGHRVVILEIPAARHTPVRFHSEEFIRIGNIKKKLKDYPEKERELWQIFNATRFEQEIAKTELDSDEILQLLDYPKYFDLLKKPLPQNKLTFPIKS